MSKSCWQLLSQLLHVTLNVIPAQAGILLARRELRIPVYTGMTLIVTYEN